MRSRSEGEGTQAAAYGMMRLIQHLKIEMGAPGSQGVECLANHLAKARSNADRQEGRIAGPSADRVASALGLREQVGWPGPPPSVVACNYRH